MALPKGRGSRNARNLPDLNVPEDYYEERTEISQIPIDELVEDYGYDEEEEYEPEAKENRMFQQRREERYKPYDELLDDEDLDEDRNIDKKNLKIIPTGANKKQKNHRIKAGDFDSRKNQLTTIKIVRTLVFLVILFIIGLGIKNTFFPEQIYTREEIAALAHQAVGQTGFPTEKGQSFAKEFIKYYATLDKSDKTSQLLVNRFFYGEGNNTSNLSLQVEGNIANKQKVIGEPQIFEIKTLTKTTEAYKISVLVSDENGGTLDSASNLSVKWLSFYVNVFYNPKTKSLVIQKNSPILIPTYEIANVTDVPDEKQIGLELADSMDATLSPVINGFLKAYATSSVKSHESILQYISNKNNPDLYSGFNNTVKLDPNTGIIKKIYTTDKPDVYKVDLTVTWIDNTIRSNEAAGKYTARYVMTIEKGTDKYVVSRFNPYTYVEKPAEE